MQLNGRRHARGLPWGCMQQGLNVKPNRLEAQLKKQALSEHPVPQVLGGMHNSKDRCSHLANCVLSNWILLLKCCLSACR